MSIHDSAVVTYVNPDRAPWALGLSLGSYVLTTDSRLSNARTPLPHTHSIAEVVNLQAVLDRLAAAAASAGSATPVNWAYQSAADPVAAPADPTKTTFHVNRTTRTLWYWNTDALTWEQLI